MALMAFLPQKFSFIYHKPELLWEEQAPALHHHPQSHCLPGFLPAADNCCPQKAEYKQSSSQIRCWLWFPM